MDGVIMSNKRKFIRIVPQESVTIDINGDDFIDIVVVKDISMGGVGINVRHMFDGCAIHNSVKLIVSLPNDTFQTYAKIKYVNGNFFGVEFENLCKKSKKVLRNFIFQELKRFSPISAYLFKVGIIR